MLQKSRNNFSSSSAKISDDHLLVIDCFPGCEFPSIPSYFPRSCSGPSIKYVTLFLANFDPLPLSHFVTHTGTPKIRHTSRTSRFLVGLVQKSRTKVPCTSSISIVRGGFWPWVLSGLVFVRSPFCHNTSVTAKS